MKEMTAVEWLEKVFELEKISIPHLKELFETAKRLEKEQLHSANVRGKIWGENKDFK